jgi:hypothetical protein
MNGHPDSTLLDQLGTTTAIAALFEVRPQAVSGWRRNGIPKARRQTLRLIRPDLFIVEGERPLATEQKAA